MQKKKQPLVTVLLPVYNAVKYMDEALASILNQTYQNLEILVIDDGSTDGSDVRVRDFTDPRLRLIKNEKNLGIRETLNKGLRLSQGEYIARMDADDISYPARIETQVNFLESNPDIAICGTWFRIIPGETLIQHPITHTDIVLKLLRDTAFGHPTVMFRGDYVRAKNLSYPDCRAEDYALWVSLIGHAKFANIPAVLLDYRWHGSNLSNSPALIASAQEISLKNLEKIKRHFSAEDRQAYLRLMRNEGKASVEATLGMALLLSRHHAHLGVPAESLAQYLIMRLNEIFIIQHRQQTFAEHFRQTLQKIKNRVRRYTGLTRG